MNDLFADRVELVSGTFRKGAELALEIEDLSALLKELERAKPEFRAVLYEGAAMQLATMDFENHALQMPLWRAFLEEANPYKIHLHIGLGWAMIKMERSTNDLAIELTPFYSTKVLDGAGYFAGLFQRRVSIRSQQTPEWVLPEQLTTFDQGIGRAIWYITKGVNERVSATISHFNEERRASLWAGIGLASTFVGGYNKADLFRLETTAEHYNIDLKCGVVSAIRSRYSTNSLDEYAEVAASSYFNMNALAVAKTLYSEDAKGLRENIEKL